MRARTLILVLLAVVLAGGTAFLARSWLASQRAQEIAEAAPVAVPQPSKSVLVARTGLQRGQILKPEDMMWEVWPEGGIDKNYIVLGTRTPESLSGWVARNPIAPGEPITEAKIIAPGNRGFLAAVLRPGMRAVSVPVTVTSGISGFVFPGDQVDILITYPLPAALSATGSADSKPTQQSGGYEHKVSETVLRDVRVIAIDQRLESKAGEAVVAHTATLEVTPKQSEIIALASEVGKLSLSLRSLVPGSSETTPVADASANGPVHRVSADSAEPNAGLSYTMDTEISPLLPKRPGGTDAEAGTVTILRGGGKTTDTVASPAASRGS